MQKNWKHGFWVSASVFLGIALNSPLQAAPVFLFVADGNTVQLVDSSGNSATPTATFASPGSTAWNDAFALTEDSHGSIYVSDAGNNRILKYDAGGVLQSAWTIPYTGDATGHSPQEMLIDPSGNLWTLSITGQIVKYAGTNGTNGTVTSGGTGTLFETIPNARGIAFDTAAGNNEIFVSTSGWGTAAGVYAFSSTGAAATAGSNNATLIWSAQDTVGGVEAGQLRGLSYTTANGGTLYVADSTWSSAGGYVEKLTGVNAHTAAGTTDAGVLLSSTSIQSPNAIKVTGTTMYIAEYYDKDVIKCTSITTTPSCARFFNDTTSTIGVSGLAFAATVNGGASTDADLTFGPAPDFFPDVQDASVTPEPSTWMMCLGALSVAAIAARKRRSA